MNEVVGEGGEHLFDPQDFYASFHPSYNCKVSKQFYSMPLNIALVLNMPHCKEMTGYSKLAPKFLALTTV